MTRHASTRTARTALTLSPVLAILASAGLASAQLQNTRVTPGDGRALDRNLQTNSGGINPARPSVADQTRINNAIITGNATDGRSFRGYVGYSSVTDFGARLGSNDLYTFRRDTSAGSFGGTGVRGTDALRYQFSSATGQSLPGFIARAGLQLDRAGVASSGATASASLRSTSDYLAAQSLRPALVGSRQAPDGALWNAAASPLLGVRWMQIDTSANPAELAERLRASVSQGKTIIDANTPDALPGEELRKRSSIEREMSQKTSSLGLMSGLEIAAPGVANPLDRARREAASKGSSRVESDDTQVSSRINTEAQRAFEQGFRGGEPAKTAQGAQPDDASPSKDGAWKSELERLRGELRGERPRAEQSPRPKADTQPGSPNGATPEHKPGDPAPALTPATPKPATSTSPADDEAAQQLKRYEALRKVDTSKGLTPDLIRALQNSRSVRHGTFAPAPAPGGSAAQIPAESLPIYDESMKAGQAALASARFFDAEEQFLRALAASSHDPMASIGRVHAQLGAGLYLSAALNLRTLFSDHPEMIGNRFDPALIPSPERAAAITAQLRDEIKHSESALGRDASLLLAYLGHIRDDQVTVKDALAALEARTDATKDDQTRLLEVLKAAWIAE